ncbi:MAG: transcriptional regulator [Paenibacillaceae bacterium]|jgi:AcrR family transcriptional regulator|nr:transcriptional regulator [Paenibacillaceae bacterium]
MEKKIGRPRSLTTQKAILAAAYQLLTEQGFKSVTVDGISEKAGVSKATIYKWWPNKAAVVMEAFFEASEAVLTVPDTGSVRQDLFLQVKQLAAFLTGGDGQYMREFIAEGQSDAKLAEEYRSRYFNPRRLISKRILEQGIARGELRPDLDPELTIDLLFAPLFYRLLITGEPVDSRYIETWIGYSLEGLAAGPE